MTRAAYNPAGETQFTPPDIDYDYPEPPGGPPPSLASRIGPFGVAAIVAGVVLALGIGVGAIALANSVRQAVPPPTAARPAPVAPSTPSTGSPTEEPALPPDDAASEAPSESEAPPPTQSTRAPAGSITGDPGEEAAAVSLINEARSKNQRCRQGLRIDDRLRNAARIHSTDMAGRGFLNRRGSDGSVPDDRMRQSGYPDPLVEEVARGSASANQVVAALLRSPSHRRNLLDCNARAIGIGVAISDGQAYWTADLGRS